MSEANAESTAMSLMAVRDDAGPFEHLGGQFSCNGGRWLGKAIASPVAVYLFKKAKNTTGYGGGIAGAILASALAKDDGLSTCFAADLPEPARAQIDPKGSLFKKGKLAKMAVVIVPRATVSFVKAGGFNNVITINAGSDKFKISTSIFRMFAKPRAMKNMGWELNTQLSPTAAPVHDMRTDEEKQKPGKPLWMKILLVAAGVGLILAVIALRIVANMH